MSDDETTLNVHGLDKLLKALKQKLPTARVGIIGSKVAPHPAKDGKSSGMTNADIGAVHEFGAPTQGIPARSFLRVPVSDNLGKEMEQSGALDKDALAQVMAQGSVVPWLTKIAVLAEGIVAEAFATGGFGKWQAWKNKNYTNNTGQLLIDTGQLQKSITSEVKA